MKKKQKGVSRKRHSILKTGNTMLNRKNTHVRVEILFLTKRQRLRKINPDIYRLTKFTSVKTAKAVLSDSYVQNLNMAE